MRLFEDLHLFGHGLEALPPRQQDLDLLLREQEIPSHCGEVARRAHAYLAQLLAVALGDRLDLLAVALGNRLDLLLERRHLLLPPHVPHVALLRHALQAHLMRDAIRGNQRLSVLIRRTRNTRQRAIRGNQW